MYDCVFKIIFFQLLTKPEIEYLQTKSMDEVRRGPPASIHIGGKKVSEGEPFNIT